jgi:hypothetical protein
MDVQKSLASGYSIYGYQATLASQIFAKGSTGGSQAADFSSNVFH